jgi:hypothetical protein
MADKTRVCQRCKGVIPAERVEALPETRLCVQCSQVVGGEFELVVTRENLGKAGSLKKISGGVIVRKRRRPIPPLGGE